MRAVSIRYLVLALLMAGAVAVAPPANANGGSENGHYGSPGR